MRKNRSSPILKAVLGLCCALVVGGVALEAHFERLDRARFAPPGRLVMLDGRAMHLVCVGEAAPGQPVVVLDAGAGNTSQTWAGLQPRIGAFARVCAYDRAGLGWSDPAPGGRAAPRLAEELHALLAEAGEPAPYVLVGHSFGGLVGRAFAALYPQAVAGVVFVDATDAESLLRLPAWALRLVTLAPLAPAAARLAGPQRWGSWARTPEQAFALSGRHTWCSALEVAFLLDSAREVVALGALGDLPVIALVTNQPDEADWVPEYQADFAALSTRAEVRLVQSGHLVHLEQPDVALEAIQDALALSAP